MIKVCSSFSLKNLTPNLQMRLTVETLDQLPDKIAKLWARDCPFLPQRVQFHQHFTIALLNFDSP